MNRPNPDELDEYLARYTDLVADGPILDTLSRQHEETLSLLAGLTPDQEEHRYEPMKWSVREVVGHCIDTERMFGFRALWFARGLPGELPSFDPDVAADHAGHDEWPLAGLLAEWRCVRDGQLAFFRALDPSAWSRRGLASGRIYSVRALAWICAGHELHHRAVLRERYGVGA